MCVIIRLPAKKIMSAEKIRNAVLNNPDGYGIVFLDRGQLTVRKNCGEEDEGNDPDEIYKILQDSFGVDRFLHVRKNTVGKTNLENTHPFTVFNKEGGRRIEFMHNGTLGGWRPSVGSDLSDTRNYAESFMAPLLERFNGEKGLGDYTDPFFKVLVKGAFDYSNRGLLISNDLEPVEFGPWEEYKDGDETFRVSNDDYFNVIMSGRVRSARREANPSTVDPRFRRTVETPTQEVSTLIRNARQTAGTPVNPPVTQLKEINLQKIVSTNIKPDDLNDLMDLSIRDFDEIEDEQLSYFRYLSKLELEGWIRKHPGTASAFVELILVRLGDLLEEFQAEEEAKHEAIEKHERATKRIEELAFELNERDKRDEALAAGAKGRPNRPVRTRSKKVA